MPSKTDGAVERLVCQGYAALDLVAKDEGEARKCIQGLIRDTYGPREGAEVTRAALRKQSLEEGAYETGKYIEWLETKLLELLAGEPTDDEGTLP